jgi:competence protein ComEA
VPAAPTGASAPGAAATPAATPAVAGGTGPAGAAGVDAEMSSTTTEAAPVVVQAAGAVHHPGVHRLPAGSRVDDLVRAAGGSTPDADLDRVNLAAPLLDGERIWVPRRGEVEVPAVVSGGTAGASGGSVGGGGTGDGPGPSVDGVDPAAPVDLNTATDVQLDALPGIGPATAAAILAHREANGPFRSVDDLLDVRGIGEAKLEQLRPLVTV